MEMIKKLLISTLVIAAIFSILVFTTNASSYNDVPENAYYTESVEALTTYGIVSGYNGSFRPNANVTRAEFAKMTALISGLEDQVYSNAGSKKFNDVDLMHWATGYINTVANNRIIIGYPDGSFKAEKNVSYAEALTVVLRVLGYSSAELGDNWPYAYMVKANGLGLTKGLDINAEEFISRGDLCLVINRALQTTINGSSNKLISKMDINVTDDLLVTTTKDDYTTAVVIKTDIYSALASVGVSRDEIEKATVVRNGEGATLEDAEIYDVVYYLEDNSVIHLFSDKISGVYNKAFPNKTNVTSVDISGTTLELETQTAAYKLSEKSGKYKIGSTLTALLGMDGKIVDVVDLNSSDKSNYGVLLSCFIEESDEVDEKNKQYNYFTFLNGEGNTMKYKTENDYDDYIGYIGEVSFDNDGYASFKTISSRNVITGAIDKNNRKIGDHWLTSDCVIIERKPSTSTTAQLTNSATVIDFDDIIPAELTDKHVVHAITVGEFDDISLLFVENVSSQQVQYGILKSASGSAMGPVVNGKYEVFSNGQFSNYSTNFINNIPDNSAVAMTFNGNTLISIKKIVTVGVNQKVLASDFSRIKISSGVYKLSDDVQVIKKSSNGYTTLSKSEIDDLTGKSVSLFSDISTNSGGLIRIVLVLN